MRLVVHPHLSELLTHKAFPLVFLLVISATLGLSCKKQNDEEAPDKVASDALSIQLINSFPHDDAAFTQGLVFHKGYLYESTGLYGSSSLRRIEKDSGAVLDKFDLDSSLFGEGLAVVDDRFYQLTWKKGQALVYERSEQGGFSSVQTFTYDGEGWGLTYDGTHLILSDGSDQLRFYEPSTFSLKKSIAVQRNSQPVFNINELEFMNGYVFANVWQTDEIVAIDPANGQVVDSVTVPVQEFLAESYRKITPWRDVLNGIAYDKESGQVFVTGKNWPLIFQVEFRGGIFED